MKGYLLFVALLTIPYISVFAQNGIKFDTIQYKKTDKYSDAKYTMTVEYQFVHLKNPNTLALNKIEKALKKIFFYTNDSLAVDTVNWNKEIFKENATLKEIISQYKNRHAFSHSTNGHSKAKSKIAIIKNRILSYTIDYHHNDGLISGVFGKNGYCFFIDTGKQMTINDLFENSKELNSIIKKKLHDKNPNLWLSTNDYITSNFHFKKNSLVFNYSVGEISSNAEGDIHVEIPFQELKHLFKAEMKSILGL